LPADQNSNPCGRIARHSNQQEAGVGERTWYFSSERWRHVKPWFDLSGNKGAVALALFEREKFKNLFVTDR
jgi:hypothetical protein